MEPNCVKLFHKETEHYTVTVSEEGAVLYVDVPRPINFKTAFALMQDIKTALFDMVRTELGIPTSASAKDTQTEGVPV